MNTTTTVDSGTARSHGAGRRSTVLARVITLICLTVALIGLSTPQASAISRYTVWQGSPGTLIQNSQVMGWPTYGMSAAKISIFAAHVRRSPATTGAQTVAYEYRAYGWNGSAWTRSSTYVAAGTIPAGQNTAILQGGGAMGLIEMNVSGFVRVELAVAFYSGTRLLGHFTAWHDQAGDYMCFRQGTIFGNCQVYSGGYLYVS